MDRESIMAMDPNILLSVINMKLRIVTLFLH